jgi:hypothetical protein
MNKLTRDELVSTLDTLEDNLGGFIDQYAESCGSPVLDILSGEAEIIETRVGVEDLAYVRFRVQRMLRDASGLSVHISQDLANSRK